MAPYYGYFLLLVLAYCSISHGASLEQNTREDFKDRDNVHHHQDSFVPLKRAFLQPDDVEIQPKSKLVTREVNDDEQDPDYPYEEVRRFVQNNKVLKDFFQTLPDFPKVEIANRNGVPGGDDSEEKICRTKGYKVLFPQKRRNINNVWKTIVNIPNEYEQGVEAVECASRGTCNHVDALPLGYVSYCEQEHIVTQLVVFNKTNSFDLFRFPSCCVCKIKRTEN